MPRGKGAAQLQAGGGSPADVGRCLFCSLWSVAGDKWGPRKDASFPRPIASLLTTATRRWMLRIRQIGLPKVDPVRDVAINLRPTPEQRDLIDQAATLLGKRRSDFILQAACERAREVFFSLDADKFQQFTALLDAPAAPNAGLERLLSVQSPWHDDFK